jgi:hypothetical protein
MAFLRPAALAPANVTTLGVVTLQHRLEHRAKKTQRGANAPLFEHRPTRTPIAAGASSAVDGVLRHGAPPRGELAATRWPWSARPGPTNLAAAEWRSG